MCTLTAPRASVGDTATTVLPKVVTELTQGYRAVDPITVSATMQAVPTKDGEIELFTLDGKGGVARLSRDPSSDTGWTITDLAFPQQEQIIAFAAYLAQNFRRN